MEPQENLPHTLCNKCNNFVLTQNYLIHQARCKGPTSSVRQPSRISSRIFNNSSRLSNPGQNSQRNRNIQQEQERIPCHYCSYPQTLAQLDTHPQVCEHREEKCRMCNSSFPRSLMEEHVKFCPSNRRNNYPEVPSYSPNHNQRNRQRLHQNPRQREQEQYGSRRQYDPRRELFSYIQNQRAPNRRRQPDPFEMMDQIMNHFYRPRMNIMEEQPNRSTRPRMQIRNLMQLIQMVAGRGMVQQEAGLSKQDIQKFPVHKYKNTEKKQAEQQDMCIICYCNFEEGEDCMTLPCKHLFHPQCVATWLLKNPSCPVCKHNYGEPRREQRAQNNPHQHQFIRVIRFG